MHNYTTQESRKGSLSFIKSNYDNIYMFNIENTEEEYENDFLDDYIYNAILQRCNKPVEEPKFLESYSLSKTCQKIIFDILDTEKKIIKIEVKSKSTKTTKYIRRLLINHFWNKPRNSKIKGLTHSINGNTIYYLYNSELIDTDQLIASITKEFQSEEDN